MNLTANQRAMLTFEYGNDVPPDDRVVAQSEILDLFERELIDDDGITEKGVAALWDSEPWELKRQEERFWHDFSGGDPELEQWIASTAGWAT